MSIFASRAQKVLEIPFDPPHTVTIQKLAGRHLGQAALENQLASIDTFRKMGGAAFQKELTAITAASAGEAAAPKPAATPDPLAGFDKAIVMLYGIKAWDYEEPVNEATLADLTEEAADFFTREILRFTKPSLFMTEAEAEADTKNG